MGLTDATCEREGSEPTQRSRGASQHRPADRLRVFLLLLTHECRCCVRTRRPRVVINANGVPRTLNSSAKSPTSEAAAMAPWPAGSAEEDWTRKQATLTKPEEGWYQKLAARGTHKYSELLVSSSTAGAARQKLRSTRKPSSTAGADTPPAWCEATVGGRSAAHSCPCVYDGMHGELCEGRHEPFCPNQCSGHGVCSEFGGMCMRRGIRQTRPFIAHPATHVSCAGVRVQVSAKPASLALTAQ